MLAGRATLWPSCSTSTPRSIASGSGTIHLGCLSNYHRSPLGPELCEYIRDLSRVASIVVTLQAAKGAVRRWLRKKKRSMGAGEEAAVVGSLGCGTARANKVTTTATRC